MVWLLGPSGLTGQATWRRVRRYL